MTYDAGALIALERQRKDAWAWHRRAAERQERPTVPAIVVAEVWRGNHQWLAGVLSGCVIETLDDRLARLAGVAIAEAGGETIDAVVMASAAQRGDVVLTSDPADLERFRAVFPEVRVFRI